MNKEDLIGILIKKNNDYFRSSNDKSSKGYIFDAQINTGRKLVMQLASNTLRSNHVQLVSPMQGGKTGSCNSVINIINKTRLYKNMAINKYLFITGMNDCGLKDQTYKRLIEQVIDANVDNVYFGKRSKRNLSKNKYFVLKNSDLMSFEYPLDNSLIFIDESHYGSNEKNILTKFLVKHGIDWKDTNELIKRNIYIVSVSATPFDELVSDTVNCKKTVELETDNNYCSITDYINSELVHCAEKNDIQEDGVIFDYIIDAHDRMIDNNENGVVIIRTRKFDIIKENQYVQNNFNVFEMYSSGSKIEYDKMNMTIDNLIQSNKIDRNLKILGIKPNTKPLMVLIKGAFRAGITIEERHKDLVYMVYDYSIKADTTAQALLGRMCGYRKSKDNIKNTYFYVNKACADMYSAWENNFSNRELIPCEKTKFEWIDSGYVGDDVIFGSKSCGNFALKLSDDEILEIYNKTKGKRNKASYIKSLFDDILLKNNYHIKYDYIMETCLSGKNHYAKSSQKKRFDDFTEDSLVFQFRPHKIKEFVAETNRNYLTRDDIGKKCISLVLDANINNQNGEIKISGNKRMLVYYVEVGQKKLVFSRKSQYKPHKDTNID